MVRELFAAHGAGQDETVFKFATDVEVDQTTEIKRMLEMLFALGSTFAASPQEAVMSFVFRRLGFAAVAVLAACGTATPPATPLHPTRIRASASRPDS